MDIFTGVAGFSLVDGVPLFCFLFEGELVGVSEYHYSSATVFEYNQRQIVMLEQAARQIAVMLRSTLGSTNVVFDISMTWGEGPIATLIELNPWGPSTEPCLFSWDTWDFDGSIRVRSPHIKRGKG